MQVEYARQFIRSLDKIQKSGVFSVDFVNELIKDFLDNPNKSSLDNKHIKGCSKSKNLWQIRVNRDYRILYVKYDDYLEFRHIDSHNKIEKLIKNC